MHTCTISQLLMLKVVENKEMQLRTSQNKWKLTVEGAAEGGLQKEFGHVFVFRTFFRHISALFGRAFLARLPPLENCENRSATKNHLVLAHFLCKPPIFGEGGWSNCPNVWLKHQSRQYQLRLFASSWGVDTPSDVITLPGIDIHFDGNLAEGFS